MKDGTLIVIIYYFHNNKFLSFTFIAFVYKAYYPMITLAANIFPSTWLYKNAELILIVS